MKINKQFERIVSELSSNHELVSREVSKNIHGQAYGEQCRFKCSVKRGKHDFPLIILVDRYYRGELISWSVGEFNSLYPCSDFNSNDYTRLIKEVTGFDDKTCSLMAGSVRDAMEKMTRQLEDELGSMVEAETAA